MHYSTDLPCYSQSIDIVMGLVTFTLFRAPDVTDMVMSLLTSG